MSAARLAFVTLAGFDGYPEFRETVDDGNPDVIITELRGGSVLYAFWSPVKQYREKHPSHAGVRW